ncbi:MAG: nucleotidyltransferase domain-containing protein [Cytophagales bacterium]|nr:nucleotidyltransferase domain-containing protein [Cytophagales bacterium]
MRIAQILSEVKDQLSDLYSKRLSKIILYGSQVRGDTTKESDIDLLIVLKGRVNK